MDQNGAWSDQNNSNLDQIGACGNLVIPESTGKGRRHLGASTKYCRSPKHMSNSKWSSESLYREVQATISWAPNSHIIFVLGILFLFKIHIPNQFLCYPSLLFLIIYSFRAMLRTNFILIHCYDLFCKHVALE